jgi:hypothetical protein
VNGSHPGADASSVVHCSLPGSPAWWCVPVNICLGYVSPESSFSLAAGLLNPTEMADFSMPGAAFLAAFFSRFLR